LTNGLAGARAARREAVKSGKGLRS
jgi:hypothetical protein